MRPLDKTDLVVLFVSLAGLGYMVYSDARVYAARGEEVAKAVALRMEVLRAFAYEPETWDKWREAEETTRKDAENPCCELPFKALVSFAAVNRPGRNGLRELIRDTTHPDAGRTACKKSEAPVKIERNSPGAESDWRPRPISPLRGEGCF